jgi:spermidine synthase
MNKNSIPIQVFFALFTISGFAGLIYESIWSHYLKLFLGHAAYAQTLVLAIFMGGMAIGSWLVSRFTLRVRNLLLGYAMAELGIGMLAVIFHPVFQATTGWALESLFPAMGASAAIDAIKWTLGSLLILPASLLLGTTFPLMSAGVIRLYPDAGGRALSMLYFTNSLGAAFGVLASGFVLISRVGLPGTILTAGIMNLLLAFGVWMITKRLPAVAPGGAASSEGAAAGVPLARAILLLAFATGAASFIYEITWIRMLSLGLGATTHAFEVMLAAFILGMALGAYVLRRRIETLAADIPWVAAIVVAKALLAVYAIWIYDDVLQFVHWIQGAVSRTDGGYVIAVHAGLIASMVVMFPAAFCAGMTLPLATHALARRGAGEASIGRIYGANTFGCIVGAIFATHVGMESLGLKNLTGLGAVVDIAAAVGVLWIATDPARRLKAIAPLAAVGFAGIVAFGFAGLDLLRMDSGVYRRGVFDDPRTTSVIFHRDGKTATIGVLEYMGYLRSIRTNGKTDAAIVMDLNRPSGPDEPTMTLAGALPLAMKPEAETIANIGFGSGMTTHVLLGSPRVKSVDSIEIERMIIEGARTFIPRNRRAYEDQRSHIHIDDAKTYFAAGARRYDVIVSEPSNPWVSGVSTLFSREWYVQVRRYIKDDGLLVQWIQSYDISPELLGTIFKALEGPFGDYVVYRTGVDLIIVATPGPRLPPLRGDVFGFAGTASDLAAIGLKEVGDLEALRVGSRKVLKPFFDRSPFPANSDYFPVLDENAQRASFRRDNSSELRASREGLVPALAMLDGEARTPVARLAQGGVTRPVRMDQALAGAEAIGVFLTGQADSSRVLEPGQRASALLAHSLLSNCAGSQRDWVDALESVVALSSPFLERNDVKAVFDVARGSKCWASLPAPLKRRVELLEAINDRDAGRMLALGSALLDGSVDERTAKVAFDSAIVGALALGRIEDARALWDKNAASVIRASNLDFVTKLLFAQVVRR